MHSKLTIGSWVTIEEDCPLRYQVHDRDDVTFFCGDARQDFELSLRTEALRTFVKLGKAALAEIDTPATQDEPNTE
jgi:hypothetical protein